MVVVVVVVVVVVLSSLSSILMTTKNWLLHGAQSFKAIRFQSPALGC